MRAKPAGDTKEELEGATFGTLFCLKTHRVHSGGIGALGVVLAIDYGSKWDNFSRPLIVAFEGCPVGRYRLALKDIEIIARGKK